MSNEEQLRARYRRADRSQRDTLWMSYIGMRDDFQQIEAAAKNKCHQCGQNPHNAYCPYTGKRGSDDA